MKRVKNRMQRGLEQCRKDVRKFGAVGGLMLLYMAVVSLFFGTCCPIRIFTGLPCPGCGITRAAVLLVTGRWQQAWQMNPVIFAIALAALYFAANRYLLGRKAKEMKWVVAAIAVLLLAVYIVRMNACFPGKEPYNYQKGSILERILPAYWGK